MSEVGIRLRPDLERVIMDYDTSPTATIAAPAPLYEAMITAARSHSSVPGRRMDPVFKTLWLEALRSGKFGQIDGYLGAEDEDGNVLGYCCLGVLCEVAMNRNAYANKMTLTREVADGGHFKFQAGAFQDTGVTPAPIAEWADMDRDPFIPISAVHALQARDESAPQGRHNGSEDNPVEYTTLSVLNDRGFTFAQIADLIEECL